VGKEPARSGGRAYQGATMTEPRIRELEKLAKEIRILTIKEIGIWASAISAAPCP
jgi:hypothetical protein